MVYILRLVIVKTSQYPWCILLWTRNYSLLVVISTGIASILSASFRSSLTRSSHLIISSNTIIASSIMLNHVSPLSMLQPGVQFGIWFMELLLHIQHEVETIFTGLLSTCLNHWLTGSLTKHCVLAGIIGNTLDGYEALLFDGSICWSSLTQYQHIDSPRTMPVQRSDSTRIHQ